LESFSVDTKRVRWIDARYFNRSCSVIASRSMRTSSTREPVRFCWAVADSYCSGEMRPSANRPSATPRCTAPPGMATSLLPGARSAIVVDDYSAIRLLRNDTAHLAVVHRHRHHALPRALKRSTFVAALAPAARNARAVHLDRVRRPARRAVSRGDVAIR